MIDPIFIDVEDIGKVDFCSSELKEASKSKDVGCLLKECKFWRGVWWCRYRYTPSDTEMNFETIEERSGKLYWEKGEWLCMIKKLETWKVVLMNYLLKRSDVKTLNLLFKG